MRPGEQLAQVEAGDVLQHAPARAEHLPIARHGADAEHVVAHGAPHDAARAGQVGADHAAQRGRILHAEQGAGIGRLRDDLLVVLGERRLDLGDGRAGACRDHQLVGR
jgi:hypothetical protein